MAKNPKNALLRHRVGAPRKFSWGARWRHPAGAGAVFLPVIEFSPKSIGSKSCSVPKKVGEYDTEGSRVISDLSTNWACSCLTSQIGRDMVFSAKCGRTRETAENSLVIPNPRYIVFLQLGLGEYLGGCTFDPLKAESLRKHLKQSGPNFANVG